MSSPSANVRPRLENAFLKRARLARLTGTQSPKYTSITFSSWDMAMIASRELASSLGKAIEGTITLFYSECIIQSRWKEAKTIRWTIPCGEEVIRKIPGSQTGPITKLGSIGFTLSRQLGNNESSWKVDKSELEAALGLWLWSIRLKDQVQSSDEHPISFLARSRIIFFHEEPLSPAGDSRPAEANLKLWLGSRGLTLRRTTLKLPPIPFGSGTVVTPSEEYREETFSEITPDGQKKEMAKPKPRRLFGYHLLPKSATLKTDIHVLEVASESSLEMMCAQEIFSAFLMCLSPIVHHIGGRTSITKGSDKLYLENQVLCKIIRSFVASGIGSEEDALTCVVPVLHYHGKLVHSMVFTESRDAADVYRRRNEWVSAEQVLHCALSLSFQAPESDSIQYGPGAYTEYTKEQSTCLVALCELYRWALLGDKDSRLFGLYGIRSIYKTHDFQRFSDDVFDYHNIALAFHNHHNDPEIRKFAQKFRAEIQTSLAACGLSWVPHLSMTLYRDKDFPDCLRSRDLAATLYLLKDKIFSLCHNPPAITLAARNGWITVLKSLLELGANPEETDQNGLNYLHYASSSVKTPEIFLQLVGNQAYILNRMDKLGRTSLHLAAKAGHKEIAGILMDRFSLDPHQWDLSATSPLECALSQRNSHTLGLMITNSIRRSGMSLSNVMWDTLMQIAIQVATPGDQEFDLEELLGNLKSEGIELPNCNIEEVSDGLNGACKTLLREFAEEGCFKFNFLQSTFHNHFGHDRMFPSNIALSCKAEINDIPIALFRENSEKLASLDYAGKSWLHYAIKSGDRTRVQQLLSAFPEVNIADINVEDREGRTPLAYAFGSGNMALTSLLCEHGAGIDRLPLQFSAIAVDASDGCRLYFQDVDLNIREIVVHSWEGNLEVDLSLEIAATATRYTPLAVIGSVGGQSKVIFSFIFYCLSVLIFQTHVYYISKENYVCETVRDSEGWFDGTLNNQRIGADPLSNLAALRTEAGVVRVFYQGQFNESRVGFKDLP